MILIFFFGMGFSMLSKSESSLFTLNYAVNRFRNLSANFLSFSFQHFNHCFCMFVLPVCVQWPEGKTNLVKFSLKTAFLCSFLFNLCCFFVKYKLINQLVNWISMRLKRLQIQIIRLPISRVILCVRFSLCNNLLQLFNTLHILYSTFVYEHFILFYLEFAFKNQIMRHYYLCFGSQHLNIQFFFPNKFSLKRTFRLSYPDCVTMF